MHFQLKKTITHVGVLTALLPALTALASNGEKLDPANAPKRGQYVYDSSGAPVRSGFTQRCVLTGFWTPQTATPECHPEMFASPGAPAPQARSAAEPAPQAAVEPAPEPAVEPAPQSAVEAAPVEPYEAALYEEPIAAVAAAAAAIPEFVTEAEPAGMVPVPAPDSFGPDAADDTISSPIVAYGDEEGAAKDEDIIGETRYYEEEEGAATDDGIIAHEMYYDEEAGAAKDEDIISQSRFYDEDEGAAKDDGIIAQSQYHEEEEGAAKDDGIIAQSQFHDEEEGAAKDDGISALSQYHDEDEGAAKDDGIIAHNVYGDDDSGRAPEELLGEPKAVPAEKLAQAEEPKSAPVTMLPVTITVEADPLFDFDKYSIRPDSRKKLDDLLQQLQGVTYGEIIVVGFADPIGTAMYNQSLSERRAASVKRYLAAKGVPAERIKSEGRGETEEYASYQSCGGLRKAKLISCLQPDRRVEVTVTAEKQQ